MCAIVDANVSHQVFSENRPPAGEEFFKWLNRGKGRLVVGGKLRLELYQTRFHLWEREAFRRGFIQEFNDEEVVEKALELRDSRACKSNDAHVIALAQISGARLLYSNDVLLQRDLKNNDLLDNPDGKVYSTRITRKFTKARRKLLNTPGLCKMR